ASQIVAPEQWGDAELEFLAAETNTTTDDVRLIGTELATRTKGA
ncbi:PLP-dependent lyase/thiolase, partial [Xanthomonas citri pv. citri]|nr:PLP-dependent lyase/thiolase [Xanthomonas citri pv. citri]